MPEIRTRIEAKAAGLKRYYTGKPCNRGHDSLRKVSNHECIDCIAVRDASNAEAKKKARLKWKTEHPDEHRASMNGWAARNKDATRAKHVNWRAHDPDPSRVAAADAGMKAFRSIIACRKCGDFNRYVSTAKCVKCSLSRKRDPEMTRRNNIKWRIENPGMGEAATKAWRLSHREECRTHERNRSARKIAVGGSHTAEDISDIRRMQKDRCGMCRKPLKGKGAVDHIVPLARHGSNNRKNLQLLCKPCNSSKKDRDPLDHARKIGLLI